jgi:hypothetical protein
LWDNLWDKSRAGTYELAEVQCDYHVVCELTRPQSDKMGPICYGKISIAELETSLRKFG